MPRTLPWLTAGEAAPRKRAIKPQPVSDSEHDKTPKASKKAAVGFEKQDIFKSSSPPPQPIRWSPSEEYIIEGLDNDDIYMMVEDEFYAVAQSFTQHLHYAEYVRRTKEVKAQNAARIQNIARPTDDVSPISEEVKKKKEAEALSVRQEAGLEEVQDKERMGEEEDDNDDDTWAGTSLQDLITSPRKVRLVGSQAIKSSTRAAAGYAQTFQNSSTGVDGTAAGFSSPLGRKEPEHEAAADETASDEDDDLDVQSTAAFRRTAHDIKAPKTRKSGISITPTKSIPTNSIRESKIRQTPSIPSMSDPRRKILFDDFDELPEPKSNISMQEQKANAPSSIRRTPSGSRGGSNPAPKKSRLNEVPTFLL